VSEMMESLWEHENELDEWTVRDVCEGITWKP